MGSDIDGTLHISDGNRNVFNVKRNDDGKFWVNGNIANPDNHVNANNRWFVGLQQTFSFPALIGGVFFCSMPRPAV